MAASACCFCVRIFFFNHAFDVSLIFDVLLFWASYLRYKDFGFVLCYQFKTQLTLEKYATCHLTIQQLVTSRNKVEEF